MESWEQDLLKELEVAPKHIGVLFNGILGTGFVERL